jgi:hypothetical protein
MRFYVKLFVIIVILVCALRWRLWRRVSDAANDIRVAVVYTCGSAAERESLIDEIQCRLAAERGELACYLKGKRYKQLLADRLAAAASRNIALSELDRIAIERQCAREAFGFDDDDSAGPEADFVPTVPPVARVAVDGRPTR